MSAATALKSAGEVASDGLLTAMVLKGLPKEYKAFIIVVTQNEKTQTFQKFKVSLKNFEENEKASQDDSTSVMKINFDRNKRSSDHNRIPFNQNNQNISCYTCGESGHKSNNCRKSKQRINFCCRHYRSSTHSDKACRKKHSKDVAARVSNNTERKNNNDEHDFAFYVSEDDYLLKVSENSLLVDSGATTHIILYLLIVVQPHT